MALDDSDRIVHLKAKSVPVDVLELLANSANWEIRQAVAKHEDTPAQHSISSQKTPILM